jgi:uncharacterized protein (TIGR00725 family)
MTSSREAAYVAVIGPGDAAAEEDAALARQVGRLLAARGAVVVCGGLAGVMAAACEGAADGHGLSVGLLPGRDRGAANPHLSVALPTGLGELRNGLVVGASDAVIAIGGSWGTLSEIALAMRTGKPAVILGGWKVDDLPGRPPGGLHRAATAQQAVDKALDLAAASRRGAPHREA